ncbi:hypothetical protein HanPSC8_Chr11g0501341 [Helianthus annuus]|nr:hypothetical protein HanPSC8_Chr11g0501341 [Helianthus annuus]
MSVVVGLMATVVVVGGGIFCLPFLSAAPFETGVWWWWICGWWRWMKAAPP